MTMTFTEEAVEAATRCALEAQAVQMCNGLSPRHFLAMKACVKAALTAASAVMANTQKDESTTPHRKG